MMMMMMTMMTVVVVMMMMEFPVSRRLLPLEFRMDCKMEVGVNPWCLV